MTITHKHKWIKSYNSSKVCEFCGINKTRYELEKAVKRMGIRQ